METICIKHPLRNITYKSKKKHYFIASERQDLLRYRAAHDDTWRMKLRFEKATGELTLAHHALHDIDYEREELEDMWRYYQEQIDEIGGDLIHTVEVRFQVELRDFYLQVRSLHQRYVTFYDQLLPLESEYNALVDTYIRSDKPIDPLHFNVLSDIFTFHEDRETDIKSLDEDLQQFLEVLTGVYAILDDYLPCYAAFYDNYSQSLQQIAQLLNETKKLDAVWS